MNVCALADSFINVQNEGMSTDEKVDNNKSLQKIIDQHRNGQTTIYIPRGVYCFNSGAIVLHSNLHFKFENGAEFVIYDNQLLSFSYPSPANGYDGGINNISWTNATFRGSDINGQSSFVQSMNHAQNISFDKCVFYNSENPEGHVLDIGGSRNISVKRSSFIGFNFISKSDYKEAIQIDYSNKKAMSYILRDDKYDDLPSYNIYINDNQFLPIMKKNKIKYYAPNPIGEHIIYNNAKAGIVHDVHFDNNEVVNSIPRRQMQTGIVNFEGASNIFIFNNNFSNTVAAGPASYIRVHNPLKTYKMSGIYIAGNTFSNINPTRQYIIIQSIRQNNPFRQSYVNNNEVISDWRNSVFINGGNRGTIQKNNKILDVITR
ncbi:N-acetylmuramoyl-L-alanine amidase [Lactobacillus sp. CBA3606]|nr:N-acetylmuramoyl-L-alanine amidase [Lactobacillus sp. CBA3606]